MDVLIVTFYSYILGSIPFGLILTKISWFGRCEKNWIWEHWRN